MTSNVSRQSANLHKGLALKYLETVVFNLTHFYKSNVHIDFGTKGA